MFSSVRRLKTKTKQKKKEKRKSEFTFTIFEIIFHRRYRCRESHIKFDKMYKKKNRESFASHHNWLSDKFLGSGFTRRDEGKIEVSLFAQFFFQNGAATVDKENKNKY